MKLCSDLNSIKQGSILNPIYITAMPLYEGAWIWLRYLKKISLRPRCTSTFSGNPLPIPYDPWDYNRTYLIVLAHLISITNDKLEHWGYLFFSLELKADQVQWWYFTNDRAGISSGALLSHSLFLVFVTKNLYLHSKISSCFNFWSYFNMLGSTRHKIGFSTD